ncbi:MAG: hypothetical protein V3U16_07090 [Candidatus Neomarinimicrobiota bacterium]
MTNHRIRKLQNGDRVVVVGGGPAGSFFAQNLLNESKRLNRRIEVIIVEKHRSPTIMVDENHFRGCNFCAGGISPRLNEILDQYGFVVPDEIIQGIINHVWIHGQWKNFRLRVPDSMKMYSVFRGSLPAGRGRGAPGFDGFLIDEAIKEGASIVRGEVQSIVYSKSGMPILNVEKSSGEGLSLDASFAVVATGINAHRFQDHGDNPLFASIKQMNPAFIPSKSRKTFIFELDAGEGYLKHNMNREVHFIEYGSKHLPLEHIALLPKGRFLSVAMIGKSIDRAVMPQDSQKIIREFLDLPQIKRILPGIENANTACACFPKMAVTPARNPFGDRFAVIGDVAGARLYKDGLYSAHVTASRLVSIILNDGMDKQTLAKGYGRTIKWLTTDNRYGRIVFIISRAAFSWPVISRIIYQSYATEYKVRDEQSRPFAAILWMIASGTTDYKEVFREMFRYRVLKSIFIGMQVTLRNAAVEMLLGLKWGKSGRYPTLVIKEKRQTVKQSLESYLGMTFNKSYEFERMYVIKIRGSEHVIMEALAKFGSPEARFLNMRIINVRQIRGTPNEVGSMIRYSVPVIGLRMELRLTKKVGLGTLLYHVDERLMEDGKLVLNVAPTSDGNNKLSIYAAFNYKRGKNFWSRIIWGSGKVLFPKFMHDVLWNHALCTIKEEIELKKYKASSLPKLPSNG